MHSHCHSSKLAKHTLLHSKQKKTKKFIITPTPPHTHTHTHTHKRIVAPKHQITLYMHVCGLYTVLANEFKIHQKLNIKMTSTRRRTQTHSIHVHVIYKRRNLSYTPR